MLVLSLVRLKSSSSHPNKVEAPRRHPSSTRGNHFPASWSLQLAQLSFSYSLLLFSCALAYGQAQSLALRRLLGHNSYYNEASSWSESATTGQPRTKHSLCLLHLHFRQTPRTLHQTQPISNMANEDNSTPPPARGRRASIAELFASRPPTDPSRPLGPVMPSSLSQGQYARGGRRLSIAELALATSPTGPQMKPRGEGNETAVDDSNPAGSPTNTAGRRISFGAKAYSGNRMSMSGAKPNGKASQASHLTSPSNLLKEAFNWSDKLRDRAERASMSGPSQPMVHPRNRSVSAEEELKAAAPAPALSPAPAPALVQAPAPEPAPIPPPKIVYRKLDATQERILKGEFMRD